MSSSTIIIFYGNCQAMVLKDIIQSSLGTKDYEYHYICNYEYISSKRKLPADILGKATWFVYQPLINHYEYDTDHVIQHMIPTSCKTISFHYNFFLGYFPDHFANSNNEKTKDRDYPYGRFPYGMKVLSDLADSKQYTDVSEIIKHVSSPDLLSYQEIMEHLSRSINHMQQHTVDVDLTPFIMENYRKIRLFHTVNHMTNALLQKLAAEVITKLGHANVVVDLSKKQEIMGWQIWPIYPSVVRQLGLEFDTSVVLYRNDNVTNTFSDFIIDYVNLLHP